MGGNLAWTMRLEDGTEYRMDRWTNAMPTFICNPEFLSGNRAAIDESLHSWLEMKADWEANRSTGEYALQMTECYAPYPFGLMPSEYGLVVTDFKSKTILSLQGYTNLGMINALRLCYGPQADETYPDRTSQLEAFAAKGQISSYSLLLSNRRSAEAFTQLGAQIEAHPHSDSWFANVPGTVDLSALIALCDRVRDDLPEHPEAAKIAQMEALLSGGTLSCDEAKRLKIVINGMQINHKMDHMVFRYAHAIPNFGDFTLEDFDETASGYEALRARLRELGFVITDAEQAVWNERIAELHTNNADDE